MGKLNVYVGKCPKCKSDLEVITVTETEYETVEGKSYPTGRVRDKGLNYSCPGCGSTYPVTGDLTTPWRKR